MIRILLLLLFLAGTSHAANPDDLLEPEKAFRVSARALATDAVEVKFAIEDGYYMYRERFRFAADPGSGLKLGTPQIPPGIIFFDARGREIKGLRVIGYQNAERFLRTLELASAP